MEWSRFNSSIFILEWVHSAVLIPKEDSYKDVIPEDWSFREVFVSNKDDSGLKITFFVQNQLSSRFSFLIGFDALCDGLKISFNCIQNSWTIHKSEFKISLSYNF